MFSLIAAIGKKRELGKNGQLIFRIKEDLRFFKETTMGHKILMGHKTWDSLPNKLLGRTNIVVSRDLVQGADMTVTDLAKYIAENENTDEEIFVIGGGTIYFELLKHAKRLYLTEIDAEDDEADTFFPEFDKNNFEKHIIKEGKEHDLAFVICKYTLK